MDQGEQQKPIPMDQLHPQQLLTIKKQLEEEVNALQQSMGQFRIANSKYEESKNILNQLERSEENQELLVPITSSLYVPGKLASSKTVMIDFGTGYFVERPLPQAKEFCDRKLKLLLDSQEKLQSIINSKKQFMDKLNIELQKRVIQVQQIQQQQQLGQQQKK